MPRNRILEQSINREAPDPGATAAGLATTGAALGVPRVVPPDGDVVVVQLSATALTLSLAAYAAPVAPAPPPTPTPTPTPPAPPAPTPTPPPAPAPTPTPVGTGVRQLGYTQASGNGSYVDLAAVRDSQVAGIRQLFEPAVWRALLAGGSFGGVTLGQLGDGGERAFDLYLDGDATAQQFTVSAFPNGSLGGSPVRAVFGPAALPPNGTGVGVYAHVNQPGDGLVLDLVHGGSGASIVPAQAARLANPRNASSWAGHVAFGSGVPNSGRAPVRNGLLWGEAFVGTVPAGQRHLAPTADASGQRFGYDLRTATLGAGPVACVTAGAPALTLYGGRVFDPVATPPDAPAAIRASAGVRAAAGATTGVYLTAVNLFDEELPDDALSGLFLDAALVTAA